MLDWESFRSAYVEPERPALIKWRDKPTAYLRTEPNPPTLALRIHTPAFTPLLTSPIAAVQLLEHIDEYDERFAEVRVTDPAFFREFFQFVPSLLDQLETAPDVIGGLTSALRLWTSFLARQPGISEEDELGLWGELWFLENLMSQLSPARILDTWAGPLKQPHDFRLARADIEVKTTSGVQRSHVISSLKQLSPAPQYALFLLSLQAEVVPPSLGVTLEQKVRGVESLLGSKARLRRFGDLLAEKLGKQKERLGLCTRAFRLRTDPLLVSARELPALTYETLRKTCGPGVSRLSDVRYRVNIEGLGFDLKDRRYTRLLGEDGNE